MFWLRDTAQGLCNVPLFWRGVEADPQPTGSLLATHLAPAGAASAQRKGRFLYFKHRCLIYRNPGLCKDLLLVIFHESHECFLEAIYSRGFQKRKLLPDSVFLKIVRVAFFLTHWTVTFQIRAKVTLELLSKWPQGCEALMTHFIKSPLKCLIASNEVRYL